MTNQKIINELIDMEAMAQILLVRSFRLRSQLQKGLAPQKPLKVDKYKALKEKFTLQLHKKIRRAKVIKPPEQVK